MTPLRVTATLFSGFVSPDPWSPTIDGILAYWYMRRQLGEEEFALRTSRDDLMEPVEGLPLERIEDAGLWWYACSIPTYREQAQVKRYLHRRFNAHAAETWLEAPKSGKVLTAAGPYKEYRRSITQHVCDRVAWHVIGDEAAIRDLLRPCTHIGQKIGAGFGHVREWNITPGDETLALFSRPLPLEYARRMQIQGTEMDWGIRPPARLPVNRTLCVMPCATPNEKNTDSIPD